MKAYLRFALVSLGYLKMNSNEEEFHQGFLFAFRFRTSLYVVSMTEALCYAEADARGKATVQDCMRVYCFNSATGEKSTHDVFKVHQNRSAISATVAEAGRLFQAHESDFIASPRGLKWIAAREARHRQAEEEGKLDAFFAGTVLRDKDGEPLENSEYLPLADMQNALFGDLLGDFVDNAAD